MDYYFTLDELDIEEPQGFADMELSLLRDDKYHGIVNEASTATLEFYGSAADYLRAKYQSEGVQANVTFTAYVSCAPYELEEILSGRLNFGKYKESCGEECMVSLTWEKTSCAVTLNARFDQKVDMDKPTAQDGITPLEDYIGLSQEIQLPAVRLFASVAGHVVPEGDVVDLSIFIPQTQEFYVRPTYGVIEYESINQSSLVPFSFAASTQLQNEHVISPILLLDDGVNCFDGEFQFDARVKGSYDIAFEKFGPGSFDIEHVRILVGKGQEFPDDITYFHIEELPFASNSASGTFDFTYSEPLILSYGEQLHIMFQLLSDSTGGTTTLSGSVTFDPETSVNVSGNKECPPTNAELYLVHEALSRVTESVTNGCARVKSSYYGRIDSQPFSFEGDGCGGLRAVTSGLKIRRAEEDNFFASPQDLIEGLNAIDNIGFDVIDDPDREGNAILRVEDLDFFYRDEELIIHDFVPVADMEVEESKHYSKINVGYKKWEVSKVNGLEEFNSTRQYSTSIDTINSTLEITSNLVAGSLPIEITRQQSFAESGGADTSYDNETFIICMRRSTYPYGNIEVETDNILSPENIFSPETVYNFRISPVRNLMRWYRTIAAAFAVLSSSINQLFFSAGTGNLIAKGQLDDPFCRLENTAIQENQNLFVTQFTDQANATPLWKNELTSYEYPMSLADYFAIKANPYGYISLQCGKGDYRKAWIKEIKFKPVKGIATFILRNKYAV